MNKSKCSLAVNVGKKATHIFHMCVCVAHDCHSQARLQLLNLVNVILRVGVVRMIRSDEYEFNVLT